MSELQINLACAELDGMDAKDAKPYTTSWDAVIPLIRKRGRVIIIRMGDILNEKPFHFVDVLHEPKVLCEALLKAEGIT